MCLSEIIHPSMKESSVRMVSVTRMKSCSLCVPMAFLAIWLLLGAVGTVADNTSPQDWSVSIELSNTEPTEYERTVLQCNAAVQPGQVMAIMKDNQPISWNGDLLPNLDPLGPGSSRFVLPNIPQPTPDRVISLLTIDPVCRQDRGNYSCTVFAPRASSGYDVVGSASKEISSVVDFDSQGMCNPVGPISVLIGDEVTLICTARRDGGPTWTLDSGTIVDSPVMHDTMRDIYSRKLSLTITEDHHGAIYHCKANFNGCSTDSTDARTCTVGPITVLSEHQVVVSYAPNPVAVGEMAVFLCTVRPNATDLTVRVSWHTTPSLESNRAYFSYSGPSRMRLETVREEDQGMTVYCTVHLKGGQQIRGQIQLVISPDVPGQNTVVYPTAETTQEAGTGDTPVTSSRLPPDDPFLLFGSYPATVAIISGGSILVALLLALIVFCCCRKCKRGGAGKPPAASKQPLRISPSTFGGPTPGHQVPGSGTDGMYMYATIFDPDEKWGATPGSTPMKESVDARGYQQPMSSASTPPVYSHVGSPNFVMETNIDTPSSRKNVEISVPDGMVGNALYHSSGEYVNPETVNQQQINREMVTIRAEKNLPVVSPVRSVPPGSSTGTGGYLAIGEVPEETRARNSQAMKTESATYMEISN